MIASELMVGDWVQIVEPCKYAGAIGRIKTLIDHKDGENAYFKVFLQSNTIHIGIEDICSDDIRPIPLEKIHLAKNGFLRDGESWWYKDFRVVLYTSKGFSLICNVEKKFKFVHELQQAMRMCGIKKEIEL